MIGLSEQSREADEPMWSSGRHGFTLVELLTAIGIALVLMALLFPALTAAREASRSSACKNNLRQLGVGLQDTAALEGKYCTGAFDWFGEGCVTEIGWVADLVNKGVTVGKMLCPSNPARTSETYWDLLNGDVIVASGCAEIDLMGSEGQTLPDGTLVSNPCRTIIEDPGNMSAGSEARRLEVETNVYNEFYNTNYTAGWFLVRMGVKLEANGSITTPACGVTDPANRFCTEGPLQQIKMDLLDAPSSTLPVLGCGGLATETLPSGDVLPMLLPLTVGDAEQGTPMAKSFTDGPRLNDLTIPNLNTTKNGPTGWWAIWNSTRQDYRGFGPVHRDNCNLLFADGSVRSVNDANGDGFLNTGFSAVGGFADDRVELPDTEVFSRWSLQGPFVD